MCAAINPLMGLNILFLIFFGAIAYFVMLYLLRGYNKETVLEIISAKGGSASGGKPK
jgi:Trk-type K+ transport system membrane component